MKSSRSRMVRDLFALLLALIGVGAAAAGPDAGKRPDAAKGKQMASQVCAPCHNADGNSVIPTNPKLAGLDADYIVKQLTDFAKGPADKTGRENPVMSGFAAALSPADRQNLAAWFSSQVRTRGTGGDAEAARLGQRLFRAGVYEKAVPACAGCHGPSGSGLPVLYPKLGGQHGDYIEAQLRAFREGSRHNNEPMSQIAFRLSDPEIKALAAFVSGLSAQ